MIFYFHIRFADSDNIYIVRIQNKNQGVVAAMREAKFVIENRYPNRNFEIWEATRNGLLSQVTFVKDIAQLAPVT